MMNLYRMRVARLIAVVMAAALLAACSKEQGSDAPAAGKQPFSSPEVVSMPPQQAAEVDAEERPLLVGILGPETGDEASYGVAVLKGATAAAERINAAGGIHGKNIEVVHIDTKGDPRQTNDSVARLIRQGTIAILSAPTGWSTFAPIQAVNSSKTIFISIGSRRRIGKSGPYVFRVALPDEMATDDIIEYASKRLGYSKYAMIIASDYDYSLDISAVFKKSVMKYDGSVVLEADSYDAYSGGHDIGAVVEAIKNGRDGVDALIYTGGDEEGARLAELLAQAGIALPILGGEDLFSAEYLKGGEAVTGTLLYSTYSPEARSPEADQFKRAMGQVEGDRFAALAYDAFMILGRAIGAAGSTNTTKVRDALIEAPEFDGATGKTRFTEEGEPVKHAYLYQVKKGSEGQAFVPVE